MLNNEVLISIVVPIYNSYNTIDRCIQSLLTQDVENIQLVMIDDGSTDKSLAKLREYADNDPRFTVISQENSGQGAARNVGISASEGKYILFVDSDDYLENNVLGSLIGQMEERNLDILAATIRHINEEGREYFFPLGNPGVVETGRECLMRTGVCYSLCAHLYKREFLVKNSLHMLEGVRYEDMDYCIRTTWLAERVMDSSTVFYNYMVHQGSVSNGTSMDIAKDYYHVAGHVADFVNNNVDPDAYEAFFRDYLGFLFSHVVNLCATGKFSISEILDTKEKRDKVYYYLKNAKSTRYHVQYLILRCHLFVIYRFLYKMKRN